jgi:RNA polymerase sigma-70 factor (ECF subfamily)
MLFPRKAERFMSDLSMDFEHIFRTQFPVLCNVAFNIIKNQKAAEDIVQDIFLRLWKNKDKLEAIDNYRAYLYRSTTNACIDHLKQNKQKVSLSVQHVGSSAASDHILAEKDLQQSIEKALDLLPPKYRAIFVLSRHEGMKYREIAEYLEISVKTVENQMGIALCKLRDALAPYLTKEFKNNVSPERRAGS